MTRAQSASSVSAVRKDLLARLGLPATADDMAVVDAHTQIVGFLDAAPEDIAGWAGRRRQEADRIVALLDGPEPEPTTSAPPVVRAATPAGRPATVRRRLPRPAMVGILGVLAVAVIVGVYQLGKPSGDLPAMTAAQGASASPAPTLDATKVADLMMKIQANPKDTESLQALADLYYTAGDFKNSKTFLDKILAFDPKNEKALVGSGAAAFNAGDTASAEKVWTQASAYYPNNVEVHYDLGFLYMTTNRTDKMQAEWATVVKLAPDSDMAKNVQQHVSSTTASPSPGASASSTPSPSPSGS
jgi:cytochrome c-type biogenesis protein CcmH/NrfG